jgi:hypothetical protein
MSTVSSATQAEEPSSLKLWRRRPLGRNTAAPHARVYQAWQNARLFSPPRRQDWPAGLRRLLWIGLALLVLEFLGMCVWNQVEVNRFALTADFGNYAQAVHQLANGVLSPMDTAQLNIKGAPAVFWKNAVELFIVPIAIVYRIWPHIVVVKWMQSLALAGAQAVAFLWMCELAAAHWRDRDAKRWAVPLAALGLLLLIANPWFAWASTVDVHGEPFAALPALAAARDLYSGRRRAWLWIVLALLSTGIAATYVAAVGVAAAVSGRVRLRRGLIITAISIVYLGVLAKAHLLVVGGALTFSSILTGGVQIGNNSAPVAAYANSTSGALRAGTALSSTVQVTYSAIIKTVLEHPWNVVKALWVNRDNLWANVSPAGLLGLAWPPALIPALAVLLQGGFVRGFSLPGFQNIFAGEMVAIGTIAICLKHAPRAGRTGRWLFGALVCALAINSVIWFAVWIPKVSRQWLDVTPAAARVLSQIKNRIAPDDEVIASQGVIGGFADREWAYRFEGPVAAEVQPSRKVWIILAPSQGIETVDSSFTLATIANLEEDPTMHLVMQNAGIWAFEWTAPPGAKVLRLGAGRIPVAPGSALAGASGIPVRNGSPSQWHASNTGTPGYVISQAYWRSLPGRYSASVRLSASAQTNVELWDSSRSQLLDRIVVSNTHGVKTLTLPADLRHTVGQATINGWGLWTIAPIQTPGDDLEVRVWTAGPKGSVNVYRVTMLRLTGH